MVLMVSMVVVVLVLVVIAPVGIGMIEIEIRVASTHKAALPPALMLVQEWPPPYQLRLNPRCRC